LKTFYFSDETKLPLLSDYFKANCNATDGSHYKNVHAGIRYVPEYHKKTKIANLPLLNISTGQQNENVLHIPLQKDLILDGRILVCLHQK
jgi:hypothetical protein